MKSIYFENDDVLQTHVSDKPITSEVSQDWHTNISYAEGDRLAAYRRGDIRAVDLTDVLARYQIVPITA